MTQGSLPPLAPEWAPHEEPFHDIARIVSLAPGFVLVPVAVPGPDLARALGQWLSEAGHPVVVHELIGDAEWEQLAGFLLTQSPPPDGVVMVISPGALPRGVSGALGLVNQARDAIVRTLRRPLLWCGPRSFLNLTWQNAPDFWSIRSVDHSMYSAAGRVAPDGTAPVTTAPAAAQPSAAALPAVAPRLAPSPVLPAPPPAGAELEDILVSEAMAQGDQVSAAILGARGAELALADGRAADALRIVDQQLAAGGAVPGEMRQRLTVLRARALGELGRTAEAIADLDRLLVTEGLSRVVKLDALLERAQLAVRTADVAGAQEMYSQALSLARTMDVIAGDIRARIGLGEAAMLRGASDKARIILSEAATDAEKLQDERVIHAARAPLARALDQANDASTGRRVAGKSQLDRDLLHQVHVAAISAGLSRSSLLAGISRSFVASLPYSSSPDAQLLSDLLELNRVDPLQDGERPLEIWLHNAAAIAGPRMATAVFREALAALDASSPAPSKAPATAAPQPAPGAGSPARSAASSQSALDSPLCVLLFSRNDEDSAWTLRRHIAPLLRARKVRWWSADQITPGEDVSRAIEQQVTEADVLIVLVSPDLRVDDESMRWVEWARDTGKRVVPILVSPCEWEVGPLAGIAPLPRSGMPISRWQDQDEAWTEVARGLRGLLSTLSSGSSEQA